MSSSSVEETLEKVVTRVVAASHPRRIILFGSSARGQAGPDSDLDLLVVVPSGTHRRQVTQKIYRHLIGIALDIDVVVVTEEDLARFKDHCGMVIQPALAEGRVLYAA